ncbi:MAG: glycosyltransferase [Candidatus Omnitrophota bacterium]
MYDQMMPNGVMAVGLPFLKMDKNASKRKMSEFINLFSPTYTVVQVPLRELIKCCVRAKTSTFVMIADSFSGTGLRGLIWCKLFALLLNSPYVEVVSNHNYPASLLLQRFGVYRHKIIPWDHAWDLNSYKFEAKVLNKDRKIWNFFYAGRVLKEKGVGDIIKAVALLKEKGIDSNAVIAGYGDIAYFKNQAAVLNISEIITFLGNVPHDKVISCMRDSDVVIVPSRINASEGMPCTIYESYIVKTPLVLSDHPMFKTAIKNGVFFKAGNAKSLAQALNLLMNNAGLYNELSKGADSALKKLIVPNSFIDIITHWLSGTASDKEWLLKHSLQKANKDIRNI